MIDVFLSASDMFVSVYVNFFKLISCLGNVFRRKIFMTDVLGEDIFRLRGFVQEGVCALGDSVEKNPLICYALCIYY